MEENRDGFSSDIYFTIKGQVWSACHYCQIEVDSEFMFSE